MKVSLASLLGIVIAVSTCSAGLAQTATTTLRGTVADPSGAFVRSATVTLKDTASDLHLVRQTDGNGEFSFSAIEPGKYVIHVAATGFADQAKAAELLVDQPATVNFSLTVQASPEP